MNIGWNFRREHLRPEQRSHYVITDGGDQPNVVPSVASVWYFFREIDFENIKKQLRDRQQDRRRGGDDDRHHRDAHKLVGTAAPRHFNKPMAEACQANIEQVGLPQWTAEEQTFAKAVQKLTSGAGDGLRDRARRRCAPPLEQPESGGSDDIGDISWTVPTVAAVLPVQHSEPARPQLGERHLDGDADRPQGRRRRRQGDGDDHARSADRARSWSRRPRPTSPTCRSRPASYVPMLAETDKPQVQINRETMARFRPEMRKFYYDAAKYETYLDQLGVKFPQLTKPQ